MGEVEKFNRRISPRKNKEATRRNKQKSQILEPPILVKVVKTYMPWQEADVEKFETRYLSQVRVQVEPIDKVSAGLKEVFKKAVFPVDQEPDWLEHLVDTQTPTSGGLNGRYVMLTWSSTNITKTGRATLDGNKKYGITPDDPSEEGMHSVKRFQLPLLPYS